MVENTIEILIKAVDEMSATMKKIEAQLEKSNKNIQKQTQVTSKTFQDQTGNLLVLGQAASSVDNIFDSYQNMQLRVENSTERVNAATDRLRDANYKLSKVQKDATSTAEDLMNAEQDVESASRSLTIAQNRLKITQNQIIGTYISIGMQSVTLIASFGKIKAAIQSLIVTSQAFIMTPLGATLAGIAVIAGTVIYTINDYKKSQEDLKIAIENTENASRNLASANQAVLDTTNEIIEGTTKAYDEMMGLIKTKSTNEIQAELDIANQRKKVSDLNKENIKTQRLSGDIWEYEKIKAQETYDKEKLILESMESDFNAKYESEREVMRLTIELEKAKSLESQGIQQEANGLWKLGYQMRLDWIRDAYVVNMKAYSKEISDAEIADRLKAEQEVVASYEREQTARFNASVGGKLLKTFAGITKTLVLPMVKSTSVHDFIIKKDGQVIQTDPKDTIFGMKDISTMNNGITIIINGDNYGIDANAIATQLINKLQRKILL